MSINLFFFLIYQMAKRRKSTPRASKSLRPQASKERRLVEKGEFVDSLDPPNHMVGLDECTEKEVQQMQVSRGMRWPLMKLQKTTDDGLAGVFVDAAHGEAHWEAWAAHPPSWMDPHLFVRMARKDSRVRGILESAVKRNSRSTWKKLAPLLDEIFAEVYLPYMFRKFENEARDLLAQWMIRQEAWRATNPNNQKKRNRRGN